MAPIINFTVTILTAIALFFAIDHAALAFVVADHAPLVSETASHLIQTVVAASAAVTTDIRLPARAVWERYGVVDRTIDRWLLNPKLNFPKPFTVNNRRYWSLAELEQWERSRAVATASDKRGSASQPREAETDTAI